MCVDGGGGGGEEEALLQMDRCADNRRVGTIGDITDLHVHAVWAHL